MKNMFRRFMGKMSVFLPGEEGQALAEYMLILILIAIVVILLVNGTGQSVNALYSTINSGVTQ